jgi:H/ACA ribonucleoprotein complex subunit 3
MVKWLLRRCKDCGKYTLNTVLCPYCSGKVRIPHPAKFSLDDKYIQYRTPKKMEQETTSSSNEM